MASFVVLLEISWRAKDAVLLVGFVPQTVLAPDLISFRVTNTGLEFVAHKVMTIVSVLHSGACLDVGTRCFLERDCPRVIDPASAVSQAFQIVYAGFPPSLPIAAFASDLYGLRGCLRHTSTLTLRGRTKETLNARRKDQR